MADFIAFLDRNSKPCLFVLAGFLYLLPLNFGPWIAQLLANLYGLVSAFLLAIPFFHNDWIKRSRHLAETAVINDSAKALKEGHIKRLDRLAVSWTPAHLRMMQFGLTFLAVAYLLAITAMLVAGPNPPCCEP